MLRQHDCLRVGLLDCFSEILPKTMVKFHRMPQIGCHVKTPAICIIRWRHPFPADVQYIIVQFPGSFIIQLRQRVMPPPAIITAVIRPTVLIVKLEEVAVWAVSRHISPGSISYLPLINQLFIQPFIKGTAMVEHSIQNYPHPTFMRLIHKPGKQRIACLKVPMIGNTFDVPGRLRIVRLPRGKQSAPIFLNHAVMRIYIIIILNIIFMVRRRDKQRIEIQHFNPQFLQIVQFLDDSRQISAVKFAYAKVCRALFPLLYPLAIYLDIVILICQHIIRHVPIAETIHQNLVHDGSFRPSGRGKSWHYHKIVFMPDFRRHPHPVIKTMQHARDSFKIVMVWLLPKLHLCLVIIKRPLCLLFSHGNLFFAIAQPYNIHIILRGSEPYGNHFIYIRLRRVPVIFRPIGKHRVLAQQRPHVHHILLSLAQFINGIFFHIRYLFPFL